MVLFVHMQISFFFSSAGRFAFALHTEKCPLAPHSGAVVAQLASARLSEREVPGSIISDFNVCFDFPLIRVAIALNARKTEH